MKKQTLLLTFFLAILIIFSGCSKEDEDLSVRGVALTKTSLALKPGQSEKLAFTIFPENAVNKKVKWSSSDVSVAVVDADGNVSGVKPGSATITITTEDNGEAATCSVVVSSNDPITVSGSVEGVWKKYSVVNVAGQLRVPEGKTLTIEEGVEVVVSTAGQDANKTKIELIVAGSLYCYGTESSPILFSVPVAERTAANTFGRLWGGIIGGTKCSEIVLDHTIVEYTGAVTTLSSPSVVEGLFKAGGGEGMVALNTNNPQGKYVVVNSTFRNTGEDAIYIQGGSCIFAFNKFISIGEAGGEAINIKAGSKVDAAFNFMYSTNTNALKLSNAGASATRSQAQIIAYNNTIVNSGWRRDPNKPKGGSVWAEAGCLAMVYNNLIVNSMFGVKAPKFGDGSSDGPDANSKFDYTFYASGTQKSSVPQHVSNGTITAFDGFKSGVKDVVYGANDKKGSAPGENDPMFESFSFNQNPLLSYAFDATWDFHLKANSPALTGAKTDFAPYFAASGITINGITYKSPAPAAYFGALGKK